jgi:hypothetical protein
MTFCFCIIIFSKHLYNWVGPHVEEQGVGIYGGFTCMIVIPVIDVHDHYNQF